LTDLRERQKDFWIDAILARRGLRHHTLGPTGKRVHCDRLDNLLGLRGRFCYLHDRPDGQAIQDPIILKVRVNGNPIATKRAAAYWYPSHLYRRTTQRHLRIQEYKFITEDDVLCDQIELTNEGDAEIAVTIETSSGALPEASRVGKDGLAGGWRTYGQPLRMILAAPARPDSSTRVLTTELRLGAGESASMLAAMAVADTQLGAQEALQRWSKCEDPLLAHRRQYQAWYDDNCPRFECSDEWVTRMWWYRWFVVRHNFVDPRMGHIQHPFFYEGKHDGYARGITFSAPLAINEIRWLRDPRYCHGMIRNYVNTQPQHGLYRDLWVDQIRDLSPGREGNPDPGYEEFIPAAMWGALLVHPHGQLLEEAAASMVLNVEGLRKVRDRNGNLLLNPGGHHMGQEHAPSFTHFHDYADWYAYTELERPDYSAFFYASLCATAAAHARLGRDQEAEWFTNLAARCAEAICEKLWDPQNGYFYSIREKDGEFAPCREANGLFPFAFMAVPDDPEYHRALQCMLDEDELLTSWPFATASRKCPAFSPHPAYWGEEKRPGHCLWNGPTWPYTNSILVEAMGNLIRHHSQELVSAEVLCAFTGKFARMMHENGEPGAPLVRECYDGETGEGWGCPDYFHSSFNDLVVRFTCGLIPADDLDVVVDPLCVGWSHFRLEGLRYRGHDISIIYESRRGKNAYDDVERGLTVIVDGEVASHVPKLEAVSVELLASLREDSLEDASGEATDEEGDVEAGPPANGEGDTIGDEEEDETEEAD